MESLVSHLQLAQTSNKGNSRAGREFKLTAMGLFFQNIRRLLLLPLSSAAGRLQRNWNFLFFLNTGKRKATKAKHGFDIGPLLHSHTTIHMISLDKAPHELQT